MKYKHKNITHSLNRKNAYIFKLYIYKQRKKVVSKVEVLNGVLADF